MRQPLKLVWGAGRVDCRVRGQIIASGQNDDNQRQEFCSDERVADQSSVADSAIVHEKQNSQQNGDDCQSRHGLRGLRPEFSEIDHEQIGISGAGGDASEHHHPSHLQAGEASEGGAAIDIGTASLRKLRCNLGVTGNDDCHGHAGEEHGERAELAQGSGDFGRQTKDAAPEDAIDGERDEAPASDGAN